MRTHPHDEAANGRLFFKVQGMPSREAVWPHLQNTQQLLVFAKEKFLHQIDAGIFLCVVSHGNAGAPFGFRPTFEVPSAFNQIHEVFERKTSKLVIGNTHQKLTIVSNSPIIVNCCDNIHTSLF